MNVKLVDDFIFTVKDCWILVSVFFCAVYIKFNTIFDFFFELLKVV